MTTHNQAEIRKLVDDVDDLLRASVAYGDIEKVFKKERGKLVSPLSNLFCYMH